MQKPEQRDALKGRNAVRILRGFRSGFETYLAGVMEDCWRAAQEAEFLVLSSIVGLGVDIASQRDIPMAVVSLQPLFPPTRAFPMFMLPFRFSLGGGYNYLTYTLYMRGVALRRRTAQPLAHHVLRAAPLALDARDDRHPR